MLKRLLAVIVFVALMPMTASGDEIDPIMTMRGFQIDFRLCTQAERKKVFKSLDKQLAIVEAANVPENVLTYFRTVPIVLDPNFTVMNGEYRQVAGHWIVRMKVTNLPADRPIVLHELLHAYQREVLKGGAPAIRQAFIQGKDSDIYPKRYRQAHFLENGREYFAVIGSIFLFGKRIDQPPFDCSIPAKAQPEFIAFLAEQFGPHTCR
jgi:hypothetical protein